MPLKIIKNISQLFLSEPEINGNSDRLEDINVIAGGVVVIEDEKIIWAGKKEKIPSKYLMSDHTAISGENKVVTPGFIDPHTHTVFGGSREMEFEEKIQGVSYLEIARRGGGIASTVAATRKASVEELVKTGIKRLNRMLAFGVTTIEIKSGYGLSFEDEIKMLEAVKILDNKHVIDVVPTFLGAHIIPGEYKKNRREYINIVKNEMIPEISGRGLAKFCDVFVEQEAYTINEARDILSAGKEYGLIPKLHTNQFTSMGGISLAKEVNAVSVDHMENITSEEINELAGTGITAVLLPGVSFFLALNKYAPAKKMLNKKIPVALSTDFNPGSSMTDSLPMVMSIACTQMRMTPAEALMGVTIQAAKSLGISEKKGSISAGKIADLLIFDIPDYRYIPYHFGSSDVFQVIKNGRIVYERKEII